MAEDHSSVNKKVLVIAFFLTFIFCVTEIVCGYVFYSLGLLSEGFHMLSDSASLCLSFAVIILGAKAATAKKTFGYRRAETIAAFFNGLALLAIPVFVTIEAVKRMIKGAEVAPLGMLAVACCGLLINLLVAYILSRGNKQENLNLKAALLHVIADITSSVGVIAASLLIMFFKWQIADPAVSMVVSVIIFIGGIKVTKESLHVLMESVPYGVNTDNLKREILSVKGVKEILDLKVWSIASFEDYMTVHVKIEDKADSESVLSALGEIARNRRLNETIQINT